MWRSADLVTEPRSVKVTIAYFASARECAGTAEEQLELPQATTLQQLFSKVMANHPKLAEIKHTLRSLLNGKSATDYTELKDGDRIAIIPPVGGGAQAGSEQKVRSRNTCI